MEHENKFISMLQQANALYIQAEDMEKSGDCETAKSYYLQTSSIFEEIKNSPDVVKHSDSAKSMELIATSCKRKIKILELKQTLIPKAKELSSAKQKEEASVQEVDLNQSLVAKKLNDMAEEDTNKDSKILQTSIAKLKTKIDKIFEKYHDSLLDNFSRLETSFKTEIKKKIVEDDSNPFNENPGNVAIVEDNMYKLKTMIQRLERLKEYVINNYQKELTVLPPSTLNVPSFNVQTSAQESKVTVQESRMDRVNTHEKYERLKIRYDKIIGKFNEKNEKVRELEYQLDKADKIFTLITCYN